VGKENGDIIVSKDEIIEGKGEWGMEQLLLRMVKKNVSSILE
jgi:hypothetical protein